MGHFDLFLSYISTIFIITILRGFQSKAQTPPTYIFSFCTGSNIKANSTYKSNLNLLLSSLSSSNNNTIIKNGYFNTTAGQNPNTVFGAFQCKGDDTKEVCQNCVTKASQDITQSINGCPNLNQAIIIYDECLLRYSNESFFSIMQPRPAVYLSNTVSVTNPDQFNKVLGEVMDNTVKEAISNGTSFKNYAIGDKNYTQFKKIYGSAQCTSDLSSSDCNICLRGAVGELPECCGGKEGGRVVRASCIVRYEIYPIVGSNLASPPALAPSPVLPPVTTTTTNSNWTNTSTLVVSIVVPSVISVLLTVAVWCFCLRRKQAKKIFHDNETKNAESLQLNFSTISAATNDFSEANKLGQGGFGPVYKGVLPYGQEIAVKRLSKNSCQGEREFKNEVILLAKLQHRNLVRLLGFCFEEEEKLLVYEFMPNGSLDQFIFDPTKRAYLDWEIRYKIIGGIARGLLYLHEDSRLKIIHRDLKASNILLDGDMNPKISDFGMARLFVVDQTRGSTSRIVGTYGYMSPEYAMHGQFSVKSDVFSFGVTILQILSGLKNNSFYESEVAPNLLSYVWIHWKNGRSLDVLDPSLRDNCSRNEVMRCIHIGLLCVQEVIFDRPTMASVILMLNSYSTTLASPSPPAFFAQSANKSNINSTESSDQPIVTDNKTSAPWSVNEVTITNPYPR